MRFLHTQQKDQCYFMAKVQYCVAITCRSGLLIDKLDLRLQVKIRTPPNLIKRSRQNWIKATRLNKAWLCGQNEELAKATS